MSRLAPGLIELNKGLNLNTAKIAAPEGTLLDSLNYEQVDFQGQKRIDGYVRYDGSLGSYIDDFLRVEGITLTVGSVVYVNASGELGTEGSLFGIAVGTSDVAVINETLISKLSVPYSWGRELTLTADEHYELVLQYNDVLRARTTDLPGPIAGLHWFKDRLYAVASVPVVEGTAYPNTTYNGYPVLKSVGNRIYLGTSDAVGVIPSDMASFFASRSEAQAEEELGSALLHGWEFSHLGWVVPYENAVSLFGSLVSLNQNRQDVGVQGPTSTEGNRGRALNVSQKVVIAGAPVQANGWKPSDKPASYDIKNYYLYDVDDAYLYADAFISWDGETGVISAPGLNDNVIPEYSPTAAVPLGDTTP